MSSDAAVVPELGDEQGDEDPCAIGHSWEYLYSVYQCNNCNEYEEE